ncbi:alpha/beta-gliadin clone PW1215-like [Helianthus annuus]|uniref:alpha/beta-gliadin clone PW1215-like n=1 Tax=Helianthus annuus TaxID=4232 RepID=UPI000B8EF5A2|nr:alpha/beta-gliadin clone PW1215-like [Helianthus annuus]
MRKLQQQRALAAANREMNSQTQDMINRRLANFHTFATTAADPNLEQLIAPQPLPLFPTQPMEIEPNPVDQIPAPAFDPVEIPRVPAPHPPDYDPWFDDHMDYQQRYPLEDEPMQNPVAPYPDLDPLDPYWDNDQYIREILENPYPYEEPMPQFPDPIPTPVPPMSTENVQELGTFGEEILEGSKRMRQIGERLVWKYDECNMQYWMNPYQ